MRATHSLRSAAAAVAVTLAMGVFAAQAQANPFSFVGISNNDAGDTAILEAQMQVTVSDGDPGEVVFTFENLGPEQSTIARVYFDDDLDLLTGILDLNGSAGVNFSEGGAPPDLPAGNEVGFEADYRATADSPAPENGINPGEFLDVVAGLSMGVSTDDVIDAIDDLDLRLGIHVINFESGGSESGVTIPEPSSFAAISVGLLGLAGIRRRRS